MEIRIPNPDRKRALILVDLQRGFVNEENAAIVPYIQEAIREGGYARIAEATFSTEPNPLWEKQVGFAFAKEPTVSEIADMLGPDTIRTEKGSKSAFKGSADLASAFRAAGIEEVHVVGIDTHDCVLATAEESFDLGFFTYVLEECTASSAGQEYKDKTLDILREVEMTNRSSLIPAYRSIHA